MGQPQSASAQEAMSGPVNPGTLEAAFTRLRDHLETKDVTIEHVKEVAIESLRRAKALIDLD
jgi:hypothetical protein